MREQHDLRMQLEIMKIKKQQQQQQQTTSESLTHTYKSSLSRKTKKYQKKMLYISPYLFFR